MENDPSQKDFQAHLGGALETATRVLTDPKGFYAAMPREGGFEEPGIFAAIMLVATAVVQALLALIGFYPMGFIATLILTPIFGAIGLAIGAFIVMFASRALAGEATFESSLRIVAYASAIFPIQAILGLVPYLPLVASAYGMYLIILAVIEVHRVPESKAWTILGGIAAVLLDSWEKQIQRSTQELNKAAETMAPQLEKSAKDFGKAAEKLAEEMRRAAEKTARDTEQGGDEESD
jgi:hypothetical protein